jgi:hypothetical protein
MIAYFCEPDLFSRLSSSSSSTVQSVLEIPTSQAEKVGIARVLRFMTRLCRPRSHSSSGVMRIPQGSTYLKDGIETVRACWVLNLNVDAERLSRHIDSNLSFSDDSIDTMWNAYSGELRESGFGDVVVWYILKSTQGEGHGLKEELLGMLEHDEFKELKERMRNEVKLRLWRGETREEFLDRWSRERRRKERKRVRLEAEERERAGRVEAIEKGHREEKETREAEGAGSANALPESASDNRASARSHVRSSPDSVCSTHEDKELPTPPSDADLKPLVITRKPLPDLRSQITKSPTPTHSSRDLADRLRSHSVPKGRPADA